MTEDKKAVKNAHPLPPRTQFIFHNLVTHLHKFVEETSVTTDEWMTAIQFLTRVGQTCTDIRQEFILLSDVLGVSALVDALNNPPTGNATESTVLGPFFTEDAAEVAIGDSIASEGKGEYLWVQGRVLDTKGNPISGTILETWETDENGFYDTQYASREKPDCRGRLRTDQDGKFAYRAVVPVAYPIPGDGPVGHLLDKLGRHNMRPNHLHMMLEAPGYHKLVTSLYPEGDEYLNSDAVFGVKKSLVVKLKTVESDADARAKGFAKGGSFKLLEHDFVLLTEEEAKAAREAVLREKTADALL
ncbi:aromatic compound dioxygenase [Rickenella mellea]|uniref:Aromatic compound dioxygenase n=1 Tax=Rickenella mellea TaxID=50990 RepID=A0A4V6PN28_9AGAM|nr:aromatic compound dioxygenase [Rickenella mellea]